MDKRLWVNLSKTVVMSMVPGACASALGDFLVQGHLQTFWPNFVTLTLFNYGFFYKRGVTWRKSLEQGAAEFDRVRHMISQWFNDHNNGHMAGA